MNKHIVLLLAILVPFSALSAYAMISYGYLGIWEAGTTSAAAVQILADLVIACVLIVSWMLRDAREKGLNAWPFVAITLAAGSFGPLLYLLFREWKSAERQPAARTA